MAGFVRRFTRVPSTSTIQQIESTVIIDLAPPDPATGAGSGTVLCVGEFEDGLFAADASAIGSVEVFGSEDLRQKFGGFGYTYGTTVASNPCARRHLGEFWNGNGWLKLYKLRAQRLMISRVDTSVGTVAFDPLASQTSGVDAPYVLAVGDTLDCENEVTTGSSTAIAGAVATVAGASGVFTTIVSGDAIGIGIDGGPVQTVTFGAADTTVAAVVARINNTLGYTAAAVNATECDISGQVAGSSGSVQLVDTVTGTLAKIGHSAATTAGTGNVGNVNAVTAAEIVTLLNASAGLAAINVQSALDEDGRVRVYNTSPASTAELRIDPAQLGTKLAFSLSSATAAVTPADHEGGTIAAGTRVRASTLTGQEWVTMQTLDIEAGELGPFAVKVRPALDDGTDVGAAAGTIDTIADPSDIGVLSVSNASALTAALTEAQLDNAYAAAFDATLDLRGSGREANFTISSRRSDVVVAKGLSNAKKATECGLFARKFTSGDPLGTTVNQAIANIAALRTGESDDRLFYTTKGLKVRIPEIAERGTAGGLGFTADGIITVRPDGPLTAINATLNPEEDPGQQTGLISDFFEVDTYGETLDIDSYKAFKRNGLCVPRDDRVSGMVFQSGVTASLVSGRTDQNRRKMADLIQDTAAELFTPFVKRLNTADRRRRVVAIWDDFLSGLQTPDTPETSRISGFDIDFSANAGNTDEVLALGIFYIQTTVRTYSSLKNIVVQTEIGPSAVVSNSI